MSLLLRLVVLASAWLAFTAAPAGADAGAYRLGASDKLRVTVFEEPDLSGEFEVDGTGNLSMPLIGQVNVGGMTLPEVEAVLIERLRDGFLQRPKVAAEVLNYRPFYILGEVNTPGSYNYVSGMTVLKAVAQSGGFTYRASRGGITIVRSSDGSRHEVDRDLDVPIYPGDIIEVGERFF